MDFVTATELNAMAGMDLELMTSSERAYDFVHKLQQLNRAGYLTARSVKGHRGPDCSGILSVKF